MLSCSIFAQKNDVILLENGNHILGEIKKLAYGVLSYGTDDISTLSIKWKDIRKIKSDLSFEVTLRDRSEYLCSLDTTSNIAEVVLVIGTERKVIPLSFIVGITKINKTFFSRIDGDINLGIGYTKSSEIFSLNFNENMTYRSFHHKASLNSSANITNQKLDSIELLTSQLSLTFSYRRYLAHQWFLVGFTGVEQNSELGLNARLLFGEGAGKDIFETNVHSLST